jgi:feruloyl esterase
MKSRVALIAATAVSILLANSGHAQNRSFTAGGQTAAGSEKRCSMLAELKLPELVAVSAEPVAAGTFSPPATGNGRASSFELPAFCRVRGTVTPAITFEVWLPYDSGWNGRFQAVGGGGFAGVISYPAMAGALANGYVTASTDTGHQAPEVEWLSNPRLLRDYGYRGIYEMTAKAKASINAFYDRPADFNYFNGCSTGGRQGLMEAQRFPDDYDGIVSGAPVNYFVNTHFGQLWVALVSKPVVDEANLSADDLELVNRAVLDQCDALDGLSDGLIENPLVCPFDPGALQCAGASEGQCLDRNQVNTLRSIYSGPINPTTGEALHPGLARGGEPTWSVVSATGLVSIPQEYFARSVFQDLDWDWRSFDFSEDVELARQRTGAILDAIDPDLASFRDNGSKLILYHGWNDQVIFPEGSIDYYESVDAELAAQGSRDEATDDFFRLFMVPGMTHCRGGPGATSFDAQSAIENWVEREVAPQRIEASHVEAGSTTFSRPLCPYPQQARYRGTGDRNRAENFVCFE